MRKEILKNSLVFFTRQIFLIGTTGEDGRKNFAPVSWVGDTSGPPAGLVRRTRRKSGRLLRKILIRSHGSKTANPQVVCFRQNWMKFSWSFMFSSGR